MFNFFVWAMVAIIYASLPQYPMELKMILFLQPLAYLLGTWGIMKKNQIVYWALNFFVLLNILFSFNLDNFLMKFIFIISILASLSLLLLYKDFGIKNK